MENTLKYFTAFAAGVWGFIFGKWDTTLNVLAGFLIASFLIELMAAIKKRELSWGGLCTWLGKGCSMLIFIGLAHGLDLLFGARELFRDGIAYFYLAVLLSEITSTAKFLGLDIPQMLIETIERLKNKGNGLMQEDKEE